ncbi:heparanase-like protein 1 [Ziziphus jujuba]|uniref:Heparanase-like protein 1 n=1 Tax=Ziziphus jujuba TaxID=326968 RepID=A0ABM3I209_ZIZJJ|nr:heparanase-like protein 1 [Ziziphus jujuba]
MEMKILFSCLFVLFSLCLADNIDVSINGETAQAITDENFICATLDWWPDTECNFGYCSWIKSSVLNIDLNNELMINAIKAFGNLRIRIGGSLQDQVVYDMGYSLNQVQCPAMFTLGSGGLFGYTPGCLTQQRWDDLNALFQKTGAKLTFGLNALAGKEHSSTDNALWVGNWDQRNARDLMEYSISKGYQIDSYELGNELSGSGVGARIDSDQYAKDMIQLKKLVTELYPDPTTRPKIIGPGGFYDKAWYDNFLQKSGPNVVDGLSHHIYNLGAGGDPNLIFRVQDPIYLDNIAQTFQDAEDSVKEFAPWSGAWISEAGGAYQSGGRDVSHTFVDGFWYLDQLGMSSTFNHKVYCRQALLGGNYALLNEQSMFPNPDYYGALLWNNLMGNKVLATKHSGSPYLRAYAHCSKDQPGVSVLLINMSNSTIFDVSVINDFNLYPDQLATRKNGPKSQREEYHLTAEDGYIQSDVVLLNGVTLRPTDGFQIPPLTPNVVDNTGPISVAPDSIVFVVFKDFKASVCSA